MVFGLWNFWCAVLLHFSGEYLIYQSAGKWELDAEQYFLPPENLINTKYIWNRIHFAHLYQSRVLGIHWGYLWTHTLPQPWAKCFLHHLSFHKFLLDKEREFVEAIYKILLTKIINYYVIRSVEIYSFKNFFLECTP